MTKHFQSEFVLESISTFSPDFSDVFVVDAVGNKIPWNAASRISQDEMKAMMQDAVDRVYAVLSNLDNKEFEESVLGHAAKFTTGWDDPSEP